MTVIYRELEIFSPQKTMEFKHEHFRAMVFYDFKRSLSQQECFNRLKSAFGDEVSSLPSLSTVDSWYDEFSRVLNNGSGGDHSKSSKRK